MSEYTTVLTQPFSLEQAADTIKTAFDAQGFGTGLVGISGGYRVTNAMQTDSIAVPVQLKPDNTVTKPVSWTNLSACEWVDNLNGKNILHPVSFHSTRQMLVFWIQGVSRVRLKITPRKRLDGATTGNWSDLQINYLEQLFSNNSASIGNQGGNTTHVDKSIAGTYTVGVQATTAWSHITGQVQMHPMFLLRAFNAFFSIDAIEYEASQNVFAVQDPSLNNALIEFRCGSYSGGAYSIASILPVKNAWTPRVLLTAPESIYRGDEANCNTYFAPNFYHTHLWNSYRTDNYSLIGVRSSYYNSYAVLKNYSFGSNLNLSLSANPNKESFLLEMSQVSKTSCRLMVDKIDKVNFVPATSTQIPERTVVLKQTITPVYSSWNDQAHANELHLFDVRGATKVLSSFSWDNPTPTGQNVAGTVKIYKVIIADTANGKTVTYNGLHATIPMLFIGASYQSGALSLSLPVGTYAVAMSTPSACIATAYGSTPIGKQTRDGGWLGSIYTRDPFIHTAWTAGTTQLNITPNLVAGYTGVAANFMWTQNFDCTLVFNSSETPSQTVSAFGEGIVALSGDPRAVDTANYNLVADNLSQENMTTGGFHIPCGVDLALSTVYGISNRYLSPLPNWFTSTRERLTAKQPILSFSNYTGIWDAWGDAFYLASLPLKNTKIRTGISVLEGNAYTNPDTTKDVVYRRCTLGNRSICFRSI